MSELKNKIEALLFSSGRKMGVEELTRLCRAPHLNITEALNELKGDYEKRDSALMLLNEDIAWKLVVKERLIPLVQKIVTETELNKSVLETLAVIAWKYPILQSELVKMRTSKAYEDLGELENSGYITRQKQGRTNLIKLTQRFFDYFDLPQDRLKEQFKDFEGIARAIEEREKGVEKAIEKKKEVVKEKAGIVLVDNNGHKEKLKVYDIPVRQEFEAPVEKVEIIEDKKAFGDLELVDDIPEEEVQAKKEPQPPSSLQIASEEKEDGEQKEKGGEPFKKERGVKREYGIKLTPEIEEAVNKRVEEIFHPAKIQNEQDSAPNRKVENKNKSS